MNFFILPFTAKPTPGCCRACPRTQTWFVLPPVIQAKILSHLNSWQILSLLKYSNQFNKSVQYLIKYNSYEFNFIESDINDNDLVYLKGIHTINLSNCDKITDSGLVHLKNVHTIDLECCKKITDAGLVHLKNVQTIDISGCEKITDTGVAHLKNISKISNQIINEQFC